MPASCKLAVRASWRRSASPRPPSLPLRDGEQTRLFLIEQAEAFLPKHPLEGFQVRRLGRAGGGSRQGLEALRASGWGVCACASCVRMQAPR